MAIADRIGVGIFAAVSAGTAALGVWQLRRREDKIAQIAARRAKLTSDQALLGPDSAPAMFSRIIVAPGTQYTDSKQFLVGPRAGPVSITGRGKGTGLSAGGLGYYVITPFVLSNGHTLLVNRGWCHRADVQLALDSVHVDNVAGSAAIVRPSEYSSADVTPRRDSNVFVCMDAEEMGLRTDLNQSSTNFFVDLLDEGTALDTPSVLRRRTVDDFLRFPVSPETHVSYAFTWFALSAASAIIGALRFRQKRSNKLLSFQ